MTEYSLGPADRDNEVPVRTGDRILLRLPENPTTGYRWSGQIPGFLRLVRDSNETGEAPGAGGVRVLEFEAVAPGRAELRLALAREWEAAGSETDRYLVTVEVG